MDAIDKRMVTPVPAHVASQAAVAAQNWKLLALYNYYRLTVSGGAAVLALTSTPIHPFGVSSPELFLVSSLIYAALGIGSLITIHRGRPDFDAQATMQIFGDIALITLLMHASGGLSSGLGLLLLVAVAASSLMLGKKLTIFYAALATLAALVEHSWGWWTRAEVNMSEVIQGYPQVGMLGIGLFATAMLGYTLATRLRATEALAVAADAEKKALQAFRDSQATLERQQGTILDRWDVVNYLRYLNGQKGVAAK